ncbi:MAG: glycoside hydrolase family 28 protein [Planctomycetota bacterium]|jgi:polygalacturonase
MNRTTLRRAAATCASLALLTALLFPAGGCSPREPAKAPVAGTHEGWGQVPGILSRIVPPTFPDRAFKVTDYGAVGDGVTDCNEAFKKAIAACARAGGGRVVVPGGTFLTNGPIHLDSNVNLHVSSGATIKFGTRFEDYLPRVRVRWEGVECYNYSPLIYAYRKTNVAITGPGTIDGQAKSSWVRWNSKQKPGTEGTGALRKMGHDLVPVGERKVSFKPTMIEPFECENVLVEDVRLIDYPFWCVHPTFCTNVTIRNLTVDSHNSNNDGVNPDSCTDVLIENCHLDQSDDSLAIKAGRDQDAWRAGRPCQNIIIRDMKVWDGIAIGSEMSGGVRNVFVENCTLQGSTMLYCKSNLDRGGFIENIYVRNIKAEKSGHVLRFRNNYHGYRGGNYPTRFRSFHIENIEIKEAGKAAISITGVEGAPIKDVFLKDVTIGKAPVATELRYVDNIVFTNVSIGGELQPTRPEPLPPTPAAAGQASSTPTIVAARSGNWSDVSIWNVKPDGTADRSLDRRLPDGTRDKRVVIGGSDYAKSQSRVTVTLDVDIDATFNVRVYEHSTLVVPSGRTLKTSGKFRPDRTKSRVRQTGGTVDVGSDLRIDDKQCEYTITAGSIRVGGDLRVDEGDLVIDDSSAKIASITVGGAFRTDKGDGDTTTRFVAHAGGVTPVQCRDVELASYLVSTLEVDVSRYDHAANGDLVLFSYTGTRNGRFADGSGKPRVKIIGGAAELVYDDAGKKIKLTFSK